MVVADPPDVQLAGPSRDGPGPGRPRSRKRGPDEHPRSNRKGLEMEAEPAAKPRPGKTPTRSRSRVKPPTNARRRAARRARALTPEFCQQECGFCLFLRAAIGVGGVASEAA